MKIFVLDGFFQLVRRSLSCFSGLFSILKIYLGDNAQTAAVVDSERQPVGVNMTTWNSVVVQVHTQLLIETSRSGLG